MWIFCCGMQRSGSTLQFQIAARLVEEAQLGRRVEWVKPNRFPKLCKKYAAYDGWKVFKNHRCTDAMISEFEQGNAMGVCVYRDLRDVFVSFMAKYSSPFDSLVRGPFLDSCILWFEKWTSLPCVLVSKYEEMVMDLPGEVQRIASHLGIELDPPRYAEIASEYTLPRQLERIESSRRNGELRPGLNGAVLYDPHTNLHANHIHSGAIGGWKKVLSTEQAEQIDDKVGNWLVAHGYQLSQEQGDRGVSQT